MPFDKQIMKACLEAGGHNILHMCKTDVNFDRYDSYKGLCSIANWGIYETGMEPGGGQETVLRTAPLWAASPTTKDH